LARLQEISSTEKLIDYIRNKSSDFQSQNVSSNLRKPFRKKNGTSSVKIRSRKNDITIGIDIGHEWLRLVKATKETDNRWKFLDYNNVLLSDISSRKSAEFNNFLKSQILAFCGDIKNPNLWVIMSAARVNVRHIRIPKVAKKQIENAVYWTIKKETPFDEKETVFDFEIQREITEQGVKKWLVMVYTAPRQEIEEINKLFAKIGLRLNGISIAPFAIQNIFANNWLPAEIGSVATLFIGNDFSRIDIYDQGKLIMTRGIKAGINSMVELLVERLSIPRSKTDTANEVLGVVNLESARKVLFSLSPDAPYIEEKDIGGDLTEEEKFDIIMPALERVVRQVERTFEHSTVQLNNKKVDKIYVSTAMNVYQPMVAYVGEQLGIKSEILDPLNFIFDGLENAIQQISLSERIGLVPAFGLALSHIDYTPNLMFRFKDKEKIQRASQINRIFSIAMIAAVLIASLFFFYQLQVSYIKQNVLSKLEMELSRQTPLLDQNMISRLATTAKDHNKMMKAYGDRYLGMAVISEISAITPPNIRLISLNANLIFTEATQTVEKSKGTEKEATKGMAKTVVLEGVILGDRKMLDSMLAGYVMKLEESSIFSKINVQKNTIELFNKRDVLHFILAMKIS
jgi:type IV pilus assembly protein PilM